MNNIFDIKRFGLVFRKDLMENLKRYTLLFLTMFSIMASVIISMTWNYCNKLGESSHYNGAAHNLALLVFISFALLAGGLLFASTFMTPMNSKLKRLSYLISPASNFEKFFTRWLIVTIGYILSFFVAMWMADALRVGIISAYYPDLEIKFLDLTKLFNPEDVYSAYYMAPKNVFTFLVFLYFLLQSLFLLGATFWEKSSFVKTFVAISVIIFVYIMLCRWAILLSYEEGLDGFGRVLASFFHDNGNIVLTSRQLVPFLSVFTIINWVLAFFRFRESEIIKRF